MKLSCGKPNPKTKWHRWFAWYPVEVAEGDCRWLEYVERKAEVLFGFDGYYTHYLYREIIK